MSKYARSHVPPKPDPEVPEPPPGDLPVEPDTDQPDIDLPPPDAPADAPRRHQGRKGSGLYRMRLLRGRAHAL